MSTAIETEYHPQDVELELRTVLLATFPHATLDQIGQGMLFLTMNLKDAKGLGGKGVLDWMSPMAIDTLRENIDNVGRLTRKKGWSEDMIQGIFGQVIPEVLSGRVKVDQYSFNENTATILDITRMPYDRITQTAFFSTLNNSGFIRTLESKKDSPLTPVERMDYYDKRYAKRELQSNSPLFFSSRYILPPDSALSIRRAA